MAAGALDSTFSEDGRLAVDIGPNPGAITVQAMVVQPDGKTLVAGGNGGALLMQRVNPDGSLDSTFSNGSTDSVWDGGDGIASYAPDNGGGFSLSAVALQADGKILAVGGGATHPLSLWRLNSDGTRDLAWGTNSLLPLPTVPGGFSANALSVQSDGKILVGGHTTATSDTGLDFAAIRLRADGTVDTSFDGDGMVRIPVGEANASDRAYAMAVQPDGRIVLAGQSAVHFAAVRLNSDGSLDGTFDGDGIRTITVSGAGSLATAVVVRPDGKILLAGSGVISLPVNYDFAAVQLLADGSLDTAFGGGDGIAYPIAQTGLAQSVALTPAGKVVLAGSGPGGGSGGLYDAFSVAVLNPDGTPDISFSGDGVRNFEPSSVIVGGNYTRAIEVAVTPAGDILVGGTSIGIGALRHATLVRLHSDGSFDPSFDGDGIALHANRVLGVDTAAAAALQPDGKVILAGSSHFTFATNANFALARVNPDGTLDTSFGLGGVQSTSLAGADVVNAVAIQPDGKIIAAGGANQNASNLDSFAGVARYHSNGTLDTSFGGGGILNLNLGTTSDYFQAIVLQPDGKLVLGGAIRTAGGTDYDFAVVRLHPDGTYDTSFGAGGLVRLALGVTDMLFSLALLPDGRILAAGRSDSRGAVVRLTAAGALDTTFDTDGVVYFGGSGPNQIRSFTSLAVAGDGKLVFSGSALAPGSGVAVHLAVARLNSDGSVDTSFSDDGIQVVPVGTSSNGESVAISWDGRILVGGSSGGNFVAVRLLSSGLLDPSFDDDGIATVDMAGTPYGYVDPTTTDVVTDLLIQPDGNVILAGFVGTSPAPGSGSSDFGVARLTGGGVPPVEIRLSNSQLAENAGAQALVGTLSTIDPNANDTHQYTLVPGAGDTHNGEFVISGNELLAVASFDYEAPPQQRLIRIRSTDQEGHSQETEFVITILDVDESPVPVDDAYTTEEDSPLAIAAPGVLGNDRGIIGGTSRATLVTPPAHGTLTLREDGSFLYQPKPDFNGSDFATYRVSSADQQGAVLARIEWTVHSVNDPPLLQDTQFFVSQNGLLDEVELFDTGCDSHRGAPLENNGPFAVELLTLPANGRMETLASGRVRYLPNQDFLGLDSFRFRIRDAMGGVSNDATARLRVFPSGLEWRDMVVMTPEQVSYAAGGVPDFDQRRKPGFISVDRQLLPVDGLPEGGGMFCAPTSTANWLAFVGNRGYASAFSGEVEYWPPGDTPTLDYERYETVTDLLTEMGEAFDISPTKGGNVGKEEMEVWLQDRGLEDYFDYQELSVGGPDTQLENIVESALAGGMVTLEMGYYRTTAGFLAKDPKKFADLAGQPEGALWRRGGHVVTLTSAELLRGPFVSLFQFGMHDPAQDNPDTEDDQLTQSDFYRNEYLIQPQARLFGTLKVTQTVTDDEETYEVFGANGTPNPEIRGEILSYDSDPEKFHIIDGYNVLHPKQGLSWDSSSPDLSFLRPAAVLSHDRPITSHTTGGRGNVLDALMVPNRIWHPYLTAGSDTVWRINQVTGDSSAWITGLDSPSRLAFGGKNQTTFILEESALVAVSLSGEILHRVALPETGIDAITYDDARGGLAALATETGRLYTFQDNLELKSIANLGAGIVPGAPAARTHLGVDPTSGAYWLHREGATGLVKVRVESEEVVTERFSVGRACGQFVDMDAEESLSGGADGMTVNSRGHVLLSMGGWIAELDAAGNLVHSIFDGLPAGSQFAVTRGVQTLDPSERDGPSFDNLLPFNDPSVELGADRTVVEGTPVTWTAQVVDPDEGESRTFSWTVATANGQVVAQGEEAALEFLPSDNGEYLVTLQVMDSEQLTGSDSVALQVLNAAPTATLEMDSSLTYGDSLTVALTEPWDPSPADRAAGFHYAFSLDRDTTNAATYQSTEGGSNSVTFVGLDAGTYTVFARIFDKDNGSTLYRRTVTVDQADATVSVVGYSGVYDAKSHGAVGSAFGLGGVNLAGSLDLGARFTDAPGGVAQWSFQGGVNYRNQSGTVAIEIGKAAPTIIWPVPLAISYGTPLSEAQLNAVAVAVPGGSPPGDLTYSPGPGTVLTAGTHTLSVVAAPTDNYVAATATVRLVVTPVTSRDVSLLVLDPSQCGALTLSGSASIDVPGSVVVNSNCAESALKASGQSSVKSTRLEVVGGVQSSGRVTFSPSPDTSSRPLKDPLSGLPPPTATTHQGTAICSGNTVKTLLPGIYKQIAASGNCNLILQPGVYVIAGGGISVSGNAALRGTAPGILVYNGGSQYPSPGGTFGSFSVSGSGRLDLEPAATGTYAGLVFLQPAANARPLTLSGNSQFRGQGGTVYAPAAPLIVSGNAAIHAKLIVNRLQLSGNAAVVLISPPADQDCGEASDRVRAEHEEERNAALSLLTSNRYDPIPAKPATQTEKDREDPTLQPAIPWAWSADDLAGTAESKPKRLRRQFDSANDSALIDLLDDMEVF